MKANDSSPSLLNIMIPQIQQLLPIETPLSGAWSNTNYSSNKESSPPVSVTPLSMCTDLSESEFQPINLSLTRKYSLSTPPLSNIKSEATDSIDCLSPIPKQESTKMTSYHQRSKPSFPTKKQCSNFSIEYLLSSSPTFQYLTTPPKRINSIFTKMKRKYFSDHYLHRIIPRRRLREKNGGMNLSQRSNQPRELFIRYTFDLYYDLIQTQRKQIRSSENYSKVDALEQLAELACKLDTRQTTSVLKGGKFSVKMYDFLVNRCYVLVQQLHHKHQQSKRRKRLSSNTQVNFHRRSLHLLLSIFNVLQVERNVVFNGSNQTHCQILLSDISRTSFKKKRRSVCFYLKAEQITSNIEILLPNNGLLYEAVVQPLDHFNDLLLVRLKCERQTYLIPIHDLCRLACPKMIPTDFSNLEKDSRVCAYWSSSLRGLHPATVKKLPSEPDQTPLVGLLFDDGDTGLLKLDEIRLLPDHFDVKGIDLETWRISSYQIPTSSPLLQRSCRRMSSTTSLDSSSSSNRWKKEKPSPVVLPQWTLNARNSTITRHDHKEVVRIGDCIVLHGVDQSLSYIGKVLKFYRDKSTKEDTVRLKWYYSPKETSIGVHEKDLPGALYESTHVDQNLIATIQYKGTIYVSYDEYVTKTDYGKNRQDTEFYLVGRYNPTSGELRRFDTS